MKKTLFIVMFGLVALSCTGIEEGINIVTPDDKNKEAKEEETPEEQKEPTPLTDSSFFVCGRPDIDMNPVFYAPAEGGEITADIQTNIPDADYLILDCDWATVKGYGEGDVHIDNTLRRSFQLNANTDDLPRFATVIIADTRHNPAIVLKRLAIMQCGTKPNVEFEDPRVKAALAHSKVDRNDDGEISFEEAACSYPVYLENYDFYNGEYKAPLRGSKIRKFTELKYFGGLCHIEMIFDDCDKLRAVTLPDFCTLIPNHAFCYCKSLKKITIPESVRYIDYFAFAASGIARDIHIPDGCVVDEDAFKYCKETSDPEEDVPQGPFVVDSVLRVYAKAGGLDLDLNPITIYAPSEGGEIKADVETDIPDIDYLIQDCDWATVKDNGKEDFDFLDRYSKTYSLMRGFQLSANNDPLPRFANVLLTHTRNDTVTVLKRFMIMQCGTKPKIEFEDPAVKTAILARSDIDENRDGEISFEEAAYARYRLKAPTIIFDPFPNPDGGVTLIQRVCTNSPFLESDMKKFPELKYFGAICHVDGLFCSCVNLESVELPDFCTEITRDAFKCCSSLKTITIPESVKYIGREAFVNSGLTGEIHVPKGCVVEETAFEGCNVTIVRD